MRPGARLHLLKPYPPLEGQLKSHLPHKALPDPWTEVTLPSPPRVPVAPGHPSVLVLRAFSPELQLRVHHLLPASGLEVAGTSTGHRPPRGREFSTSKGGSIAHPAQPSPGLFRFLRHPARSKGRGGHPFQGRPLSALLPRCPRHSHSSRRTARLALAVDSECLWCTWPPGACVESRGLLPLATFTGTVSPVATVLLACLMADRRGRPEPEPGWAAATAAPKSRNPVLAETGQDCLLLQQKLTYTHEGAERSMPKTVRCVPSTSFNEKAL